MGSFLTSLNIAVDFGKHYKIILKQLTMGQFKFMHDNVNEMYYSKLDFNLLTSAIRNRASTASEKYAITNNTTACNFKRSNTCFLTAFIVKTYCIVEVFLWLQKF